MERIGGFGDVLLSLAREMRGIARWTGEGVEWVWIGVDAYGDGMDGLVFY